MKSHRLARLPWVERWPPPPAWPRLRPASWPVWVRQAFRFRERSRFLAGHQNAARTTAPLQCPPGTSKLPRQPPSSVRKRRTHQSWAGSHLHQEPSAETAPTRNRQPGTAQAWHSDRNLKAGLPLGSENRVSNRHHQPWQAASAKQPIGRLRTNRHPLAAGPSAHPAKSALPEYRRAHSQSKTGSATTSPRPRPAFAEPAQDPRTVLTALGWKTVASRAGHRPNAKTTDWTIHETAQVGKYRSRACPVHGPIPKLALVWYPTAMAMQAWLQGQRQTTAWRPPQPGRQLRSRQPRHHRHPDWGHPL